MLPQVAASLRPGALVVSLCAGVTTSQIEAVMPDGTPVVRVMPEHSGSGGRGHGRYLGRLDRDRGEPGVR